MAKVSQRQIVAEVNPTAVQPNSNTTPPDFSSDSTGQRKYFAQVQGGEVQARVEKVYDGGSSTPSVLPAPIEIGDITVTRHYDPDEDGGLLASARPLVGKARYDITVYTLDADNVVIAGKSRQYGNALLTAITEPDGDSASGGPATFALTFSCENVTSITNVGTTTAATN